MSTARSNSHGFILPLTLWIIAAIGFAAAVLSEWTAKAVSNAIAIQEKVNSELAFANIRSELVFVLARRPYTYRGLEVGIYESPPTGTSFRDVISANYASDRVVTLDGRPYVLASDPRYAVKLQDGKGLANLNVINGEYLSNLFETLKINEDEHSQLIDSLLDYRDADDLTRLSGAEASDYVRRGLYPPANHQLMSPWEAQRIMGWTRSNALWNAQYEKPIITTCRSAGFNPNTAPAEVLATYLKDVSIEIAEELISRRQDAPFRNSRNVGDAAGIILVNQPFFFSFLPGRCLIVDLIDRESNDRIRFSLTLLPRQREQPWQIDYVLRIPKAYGRSLAQIDPSVTFPSPQEIVGTTGNAEDSGRL